MATTTGCRDTHHLAITTAPSVYQSHANDDDEDADDGDDDVAMPSNSEVHSKQPYLPLHGLGNPTTFAEASTSNSTTEGGSKAQARQHMHMSKVLGVKVRRHSHSHLRQILTPAEVLGRQAYVKGDPGLLLMIMALGLLGIHRLEQGCPLHKVTVKSARPEDQCLALLL